MLNSQKIAPQNTPQPRTLSRLTIFTILMGIFGTITFNGLVNQSFVGTIGVFLMFGSFYFSGHLEKLYRAVRLYHTVNSNPVEERTRSISFQEAYTHIDSLNETEPSLLILGVDVNVESGVVLVNLVYGNKLNSIYLEANDFVEDEIFSGLYVSGHRCASCNKTKEHCRIGLNGNKSLNMAKSLSGNSEMDFLCEDCIRSVTDTTHSDIERDLEAYFVTQNI